jgi:hypothetical protein
MTNARSRRTPRRIAEHGTSAVELVIGVPAIFLVFMLLHLGWAVTQSRADVDFAARSAARAASLAQSDAGARQAAVIAAEQVVHSRQIPCRNAPLVELVEADMNPGGLVRVRVSCDVDLSRVAIVGIPASKTYSKEAVAVIDRLRGG